MSWPPKRLEEMTYQEWDAHTGGPDAIITGTLPKPTPLPDGLPPRYPGYELVDGRGRSCMSKHVWDGESPEYDDQVYFKSNRNRQFIMQIGDYVVFEFDPQRQPFNADGSFKVAPKLKEAGELP